MSHLSSDEAYRQAGVDLKRADAVVEIAKRASARTRTPHVLGGIGGFSGAFEIPPQYRQPVLLSACDGVGTKLKLALQTGIHHTVGIDLVAMSVNDLLVNGGQPLVFLDYLATDQIRPAVLEAILTGVAEGCEQSGCALIGGETAEMPGFYSHSEYDLAGFAVGVAEKSKLYPRLEQIEVGDVLIGLSSSGLHSNGYSLVRKILFEDYPMLPDDWVEELNGQLAEVLLTPTRIYVKPVLACLAQFPEAVKAMVHITGGGFYDNIPRVLPEGFSAEIEGDAWERPAIFPYLQRLGNLSPEAMYHTFNCGIGFILVASADQADRVLAFLNQDAFEFTATAIGRLQSTPGRREVRVV